MIRKDYILRMIEEIGKMIAVLLGLLKNGETTQAQFLYEGGLKRIFNLDEDQVLEKDTAILRALFENEFGESYEGLEVIAQLISRGGDIHLQEKDAEKAKKCYLKAMELYNLVEIESGSFSINRQADMGKVAQLLAQIENTLD